MTVSRGAGDPSAILNSAEVALLDREVRRALIAFFPGIEEHLGHTEDSTRWHALGARYFHFLDIDDWVADWCRANRELATRVGLLDGARTRPRRRR